MSVDGGSRHRCPAGQRPARLLSDGRGPVEGGGRRQFLAAPGRAVRAGRRVRQRQVDDRAGDHAADQAARPIEGGSIHLGERDLTRLSRGADPAGAPGGHRADPAGRDELAQPRAARPRPFLRQHPAPTSAARPIARIRERIDELLRMVGLREEAANLYPHELSGGMKQRVCIALGIALQPKVIIADEPTSALDVVVQRQIMQTLARSSSGWGRR